MERSTMDDDSSIIKVGPVGSKNGNSWDEKGRSKIVQIFISHDDEINSIQFQYAENGALAVSECHGSSNGCKFDVVKLNHPSEYITFISGYKSYNNGNLISVTFGTNHGQYGPFGQSTGHDKEFILRLGEDLRQFGGFHGTADNNSVKSIGIYLRPIAVLDSLSKNKNAKNAKDGENWEMLDD